MGERDDSEQAARQRLCVARARSGDRAAFAELYRLFAPGLYERVLLPKLGDARAAEDALAETFRSLIEHLPTLETERQSLWPWLCRVATNKALDQHRARARARRALLSFEQQVAPLMAASALHDDLEARSMRVELSAHVTKVLDELQPRYRRAIELRFMQEHERERCAELMELKLGTFDVLLLRALRSFKEAWQLHQARITAGAR